MLRSLKTPGPQDTGVGLASGGVMVSSISFYFLPHGPGVFTQCYEEFCTIWYLVEPLFCNLVGHNWGARMLPTFKPIDVVTWPTIVPYRIFAASSPTHLSNGHSYWFRWIFPFQSVYPEQLPKCHAPKQVAPRLLETEWYCQACER
jgi:hypothetical protein